MNRYLRIILLAALAAVLHGCGYSLSAKYPAIPPGRSVDVRLFANRTYQPNIEGELRRALVSEFVSRGYPAGDANSDYLISGEIVSLSMDTAAFSAVDRAKVYGIVIEIQMQLAERSSGSIVWSGSESVRGEYPANLDLALQRNARDAAVSSICARAAQLLAARMNQVF